MKEKNKSLIRKLCIISIAAAMLTGVGGTVLSFAGIDTDITVSAAETSGDFTYTTITDDTVRLSSYKGSDTEVVIPSEYNGKKVTEVGSYAFSGNKTMTKLTIPDSVTKIGNNAFNNCTALP